MPDKTVDLLEDTEGDLKMADVEVGQTVTDQFNDGLEYDAETGALTYRNRVVGEFHASEKRIVLNAGWCRLAGISITVQGDQTDRRRTVFDRPIGDHRLAQSS